MCQCTISSVCHHNVLPKLQESLSYESHRLLIAGLEAEIITQLVETTNIVRHKQYYRDKCFVPTQL